MVSTKLLIIGSVLKFRAGTQFIKLLFWTIYISIGVVLYWPEFCLQKEQRKKGAGVPSNIKVTHSRIKTTRP
jgi:hypothetical protein